MHLSVSDVHDKQNHLCLLCPLGRLADPTGTTDCGNEPQESLCVSVDSWWAGRFSTIAKFDFYFKEYI